MHTLTRSKQIPSIPKNLVKPTIVAGVNALGRGQDRESLGAFLATIAQTIGPEAIMQFINTDEVIKRLAAAQGIDTLNLVRSMQEVKQEQQQAQQQQMQLEQDKLQVQGMKSPIADPSKNPALAQQLQQQQQ